MEYILGTAIIIGAILLAIILRRSLTQRRSCQIKSLCDRLGFSYSPTGDKKIDDAIKDSSLCQLGYSHHISNVMEKQNDDVSIIMFDYEHQTYSSGEHYNPTKRFSSIQTVMLFESMTGKLPTLDIHPGQQPANLEPELLNYLKEYPMSDIESNGDVLLVYESEIRHPPDDLEIIINQGIKVFELLNNQR